MRKSFYDCREWKEARFAALRRHGYKCMACNRTRSDGVVLHVDHIKPVSKYPELALVAGNLQVLCAECNQGKSNLFCDDLRPLMKAQEIPDQKKERKVRKSLRRNPAFHNILRQLAQIRLNNYKNKKLEITA